MTMIYCSCGHLIQDHRHQEKADSWCKVEWPKECLCKKFEEDTKGFFSAQI